MVMVVAVVGIAVVVGIGIGVTVRVVVGVTVGVAVGSPLDFPTNYLRTPHRHLGIRNQQSIGIIRGST